MKFIDENNLNYIWTIEYYWKSRQSKDAIYFPPHLINASALPCETDNTEIYLFRVGLNVSCWFAHKHTSHIRIIT